MGSISPFISRPRIAFGHCGNVSAHLHHFWDMYGYLGYTAPFSPPGALIYEANEVQQILAINHLRGRRLESLAHNVFKACKALPKTMRPYYIQRVIGTEIDPSTLSKQLSVRWSVSMVLVIFLMFLPNDKTGINCGLRGYSSLKVGLVLKTWHLGQIQYSGLKICTRSKNFLYVRGKETPFGYSVGVGLRPGIFTYFVVSSSPCRTDQLWQNEETKGSRFAFWQSLRLACPFLYIDKKNDPLQNGNFSTFAFYSGVYPST